MEIINIIAIIFGPVIAVLITLWWQRRKEDRDAKRNLFLRLMAQRRTYPPTIDWVNALNVIDVVFADNPQVVQLWHEYYSSLVNSPANQNFQAREHTYLLMLSSMARSLGYRRLEQTDIDKFYTPQAHGDQAQLNWKCQTEWLRILENTNRFIIEPRTATVGTTVQAPATQAPGTQPPHEPA
jgi:hypothetical protein